ncbi:phosphoenolpyruvate carboxylase [Ruania alba]|uniref:Phosphoenolpyruvate carboxylase n=1 Tax=Ruania alba TaxID=648782 RepID=A0A1H5D9L8_9MICO|nr:Phosphoenolpyruvate carboxylase, type 1 [Ruania alba]
MTDAPEATVTTPANGIATGSRTGAVLEMPDALRHDVRLLGEMLGTVLTESGGPELLADVERLRELAISAYDDGGTEAFTQAEELVESFSLDRAEKVARAFTCYFHLVNLAEEFHRVRTLRARDTDSIDPDRPPEDSLRRAWAFLCEELGEDEARRRISGLEFRPVLTAHPTEARRRAVAASIRSISELLGERDDPRLGPNALEGNRRQLISQIDRLWRTSPLRATKPTPLDEVRTAMGIFDQTLFTALPAMYRTVDALLQDPDTPAPVQAPAFVRLGSWIGADRDGNPNVTSSITRSAAAIASEHVLSGLEKAALRIGRALTLGADTTPSSDDLEALWNRQRQLSAELTDDIAGKSPNEPYRRVMLVIAERIAATRRRDADLGYDDSAALLADLDVVQSSLAQAGDARQAYGDVQDLIWQVQTFGFHLAELEVRQHSQVHNQTLAEIDAGGELSERSQEVLETLRTISGIQRRHGELAAHRYIISFTTCADDIAAVYRLAEEALGSAENAPVLDVIPLFETFDDLQASTDVLEEMLALPQVQQRLEATGRRVEVMLGYSDSSKDVGPVSATLALYDAQERIAQWAKKHDITLTLFHGRGGALGRGGGPANRAVLAQPPGSVDGRFKLTEQGEVIFARYGDPVIAQRHIEQVAAATLLQSTPTVEERNSTAARDFADVAERMDEVSRERFYELVRSEGFPAWFGQVTPQEEVGWLPLGSRPARRGLSMESLEDLRAIPWVFAWTQARINLTGWFGLGTALAGVGDLERLREAYQRWPLFATMIDNVEMSLAKTDERIARRYLALGDRDDLAALVLDELALTKKWIVEITGQERLLAGHRVLGRAVQLRSPYVDALSLLQLRALRALREDEGADAEQDEAVRRLMLLSLNGVAAGLQNTG